MTPLAKSLRPHPERDLLDKEAAEARASNAPPAPQAKINAALDGLVQQHGLETTHPAVTKWARANRLQLVAKPKSRKDSAAEERERVFGKGAGE